MTGTVTWKDYELWLGDTLIKPFKAPSITAPQPGAVTTDSRHVQKGDFYVALKGERFDGHQFILDALKKGAIAFFYETSAKPTLSASDLSFGVEVRNTLEALQKIASGWLSHLKPKDIIALTGSVGKTTAKEMIAAIVKAAGPSVAPDGSFNNEIGVPLTALKIKSKEERIILEFGARHTGDIQLLSEMTHPNIACVLNVKEVHLSEFGSFENILKTKTEIFRHSTAAAVLVAPADDEAVLLAAKETGKRTISFGNAATADVQVKSAQVTTNGGMKIDLKTFDTTLSVQLAVAHNAFPINVAAAVAMAIAANITADSIVKGLASFAPAQGRFQIVKTSSLIIIDDSYNASPASMLSGFKSCSQLFPTKSKIAVLGDMRELGAQSSDLHYDIGKKCHEVLKPDLLITVGPESKSIALGAIEAGLAKDRVLSFEDVGQAQRLPGRIFTKRDLVYVKGSRAMQLEKLVASLKQA